MEIVEFIVAETGEALVALLTCLDSYGVEVTGEDVEMAELKVGDILEIRGDRDRVLERLERCSPDWNVCLRPYGG